MRTIGAAGRAERRRTVVTLRAKGWSYETIAQHTGLSRTGVFNICKRIETVGRTAIEDRPRGRPVGLCRKLSAQQEAQIRNSSWTRPLISCAWTLPCGTEWP